MTPYVHNRELFAELYEKLTGLARARLRQESAAISTGTLVHELFLSMQGSETSFPTQSQFLAYACRAMRSLLVDMARQRMTQKRHAELLPLTAGAAVSDVGTGTPEQWLALNQALELLGQRHPRLLLVAELRAVCGQEVSQIAQALALDESTVRRDWALAKAFLVDQLGTA